MGWDEEIPRIRRYFFIEMVWNQVKEWDVMQEN